MKMKKASVNYLIIWNARRSVRAPGMAVSAMIGRVLSAAHQNQKGQMSKLQA